MAQKFSKSRAIYERSFEKARLLQLEIANADRKKENFHFQGHPYNVYRLKDGHIVVRGPGGSFIKNPPAKLIEKAKLYFFNMDVFEIHVPDELCAGLAAVIGHTVDAHVHHHDAGLDHVNCDAVPTM